VDLKRYKTLVFDCDGVILDSNQLKIQAYYDTAIGFGANKLQAKALVDYHVQLGGISRYHKFEYFLREITHQPVQDDLMQDLLQRFSHEVVQGLLKCKIASGLQQLREATSHARWMLVSGGDQSEKHMVFAKLGIDKLFDAGIFGSPDYKDDILAREKASGNLQLPAIYFGDSRYDHEAATRAGFDFVFVSEWTDFIGWQDYCATHHITVINKLEEVCR
jgi:phosphoglycolate phosphatase-like HAD superfamily hydrolase